MKKFLTLVIISFLLLPSGNAIAKEKRGANIEITKSDGMKIKGELIGVKQNGNLILGSSLEDAEEVDVSEVKTVKIIRKSMAKQGADIGLKIGIPFAIAAAMSVDTEKPTADWPWTDLATFGPVLSAAGMFCSVLMGTAFIGYVASAIASSDSTIKMEGISQKEKDENLEKLRRKARFPDYQ